LSSANPVRWITYSFFFSSRRRHTRFSRDWSSDVCSSDLLYQQQRATKKGDGCGRNKLFACTAFSSCYEECGTHQAGAGCKDIFRSEERRVGKEDRSRRTW